MRERSEEVLRAGAEPALPRLLENVIRVWMGRSGITLGVWGAGETAGKKHREEGTGRNLNPGGAARAVGCRSWASECVQYSQLPRGQNKVNNLSIDR